jgi:hypothetical protein
MAAEEPSWVDISLAPSEYGRLFDQVTGALLKRGYLKVIKSVRLNVEVLDFKGSFVAFALF